MPAIKVGSKVPAFALLDQTGTELSLKDIGGDYVVLYFYPKDDTPGCTLEAQEFSKLAPAFRKLGTHIVGVSGGDVRSKEKFCAKYDLSITLLADDDFSIAKKFGAYGKKKFMGREYMGILRQTFVLDKSGTVVQAFPEVSPQGHAEEVLNFLRVGGKASKGKSKVVAPKRASASKKSSARKVTPATKRVTPKRTGSKATKTKSRRSR
jgi:peroxiredoxin Q/BCP